MDSLIQLSRRIFNGIGMQVLLLSSAVALSACGGGSKEPAGGGGNRTPTANAGLNQTVNESDVVQLSGSGSDPDGDSLSFSWEQTAGQTVTISNAKQAQASFTAPDVATDIPEDLTFQLNVSDGNGPGSSDTVTITVEDPNNSPTANAGADQTVNELDVVQLDGSGSDPDAGDTLGYTWTQTGGQATTINNATMPRADFVAPDVSLGTPEVLTFQLEVSDGVGGVGTDAVEITVQEPQAVVTISGRVQYQFVPPRADCRGLDFANTVTKPIRQATVEIWDFVANTRIDSMTSGDAGDYAFTVLASTRVFLRVRAELKRSGNPSWDVDVRDNTSNIASPLAQRPLYVLDGSDFDSGTIDATRNLTATTGWDGNSYSGTRSAAPFAVLDTIYSMMATVIAEDPTANFQALDAFWSVNNDLDSGTGDLLTDINAGDLGTSFYLGGSFGSLFLLGDATQDTEEFDDHVIAHEWGHYLEDKFSRSDSIGGPHALGDSLDMRVAFGEGFATALAGIGLNNPNYCDTRSVSQNTGFGFNIETDRIGSQGWYNELSVTNLLYDLWDTAADGVDTDSVGFGPIFRVMSNRQAVTPAFTSIFSFATELKNEVPTQAAFVDTILGDHNIVGAGSDIYGSTEANDRGGAMDVLPVYTNVLIGTPFNICSNSQFDNGRDGNKLSEYRYLILDVSPPSSLTFTMDTVNPPSQPSAGFNCSTADPSNPEIHEHSDPDIGIFQNGNLVWGGFSCEPNSEVTTSPVLSGRYVLDVVEFRYLDEDSPAAFPEQTCFDITIGP